MIFKVQAQPILSSAVCRLTFQVSLYQTSIVNIEDLDRLMSLDVAYPGFLIEVSKSKTSSDED